MCKPGCHDCVVGIFIRDMNEEIDIEIKRKKFKLTKKKHSNDYFTFVLYQSGYTVRISYCKIHVKGHKDGLCTIGIS